MIRALRDQLATRYEATLDPALLDRIEVLKAHLGGYETDAFGFDPEALKPVIPVVEFLYRKYFRVQTFGPRTCPRAGCCSSPTTAGRSPWTA
ncbi:MAG: hypothetical protein R3F43_31005 [bacterium]